MGYQQKLLLTSSLIIAGFAIMAGIQKFHEMSAAANMDALTNDLLYIAGKAQQYYFKPRTLNGGGQSFEDLIGDANGLQQLFFDPSNENGDYRIIDSGDDKVLIIQATGQYDSDDDGVNLTLQAVILPDSVNIQILNY